MCLKRVFEVSLIKLAKWILMGRNVARAPIVSRRDNNDMWYMAEKLDAICVRIEDEYND